MSVGRRLAAAAVYGRSPSLGRESMKPARIIVLIIAVVAGGIAALLAGRSDPPPPPPVAQMETADVLIASSDIGLGSTVTAQEMR